MTNPSAGPAIVRWAIEHGDRVAIRRDDHATTYRELVERSRTLAAVMLDGRNDLAERRVAFLVAPDERYVVCQWAIWSSGGVAVPLSLAATPRELAYAVGDSGAEIVVVSTETADRLHGVVDDLFVLETAVENGDVALPEITADRGAMMLYTSGTTSRPKGVLTAHGTVEAQIQSLVRAWRWQPDDRIPLFLPLHHIHGIINVLSCALWVGAEVDARGRFDPAAVFERVADDAYTVFMAVPTVYVKMIDALESLPDDERRRVTSGFGRMRLIVSGSAALPAGVHRQWTDLTGQRLLERYGMTEIGMGLSNPYDGERRPGAVGVPLPGVGVRLWGEDGGIVDREERPGEIQVRGPNVFREYWGRPDATAQAFTDDGWFRTGDIAVVERGYYRILGRSSVDIIKSGGYKLSALEIEAALLDHPSIAQCAVVGLPDKTWGEVVAAAVVTAGGSPLDLDELSRWCEGRLSNYKHPRRLSVVDDLPRNAMGKVTKPEVVRLWET